MPWADFYTAFFNALAVPDGWQLDSPKGTRRVKNALSFKLPDGEGYVWVGFSGPGGSNSRSIKIERYAAEFARLGPHDQRAAVAVQMRRALEGARDGAGLPFQSGHDHRREAKPPPGGVAPPHYWRTDDRNAMVDDPHPVLRGSAAVRGQIGVERAGNAGRIAAWRPTLISKPRRDASVPEKDARQAREWLEAAMLAIA